MNHQNQFPETEKWGPKGMATHKVCNQRVWWILLSHRKIKKKKEKKAINHDDFVFLLRRTHKHTSNFDFIPILKAGNSLDTKISLSVYRNLGNLGAGILRGTPHDWHLKTSQHQSHLPFLFPSLHARLYTSVWVRDRPNYHFQAIMARDLFPETKRHKNLILFSLKK